MQVLLFLLISLIVTNSAFAQNLKPPAPASSQTEPPRGKGTGADGKKPSSQPGQPPSQANSAEEMRLDKNKVAILIKSTLLALHHANLTGNYSVLRDLGTPVFREKFDQVRLAQIFADLRTRKINLSVTALASMTLAKSPEYTKDRELKFTGFFNTQPLRVQFDIAFFQIDDVWRIAGIAVDALPAQNSAFPQAQVTPEQSEIRENPPSQTTNPAVKVEPDAQNTGSRPKQSADATPQTVVKPAASTNSWQLDLSKPQP